VTRRQSSYRAALHSDHHAYAHDVKYSESPRGPHFPQMVYLAAKLLGQIMVAATPSLYVLFWLKVDLTASGSHCKSGRGALFRTRRIKVKIGST
jgi:hypothetical protein